MVDPGLDARMRAAAFSYLDQLQQRHPDGSLPSAQINAFEFEGRPQRLINQTGIWKPAALESALTIRTTYTRATEERPYADDVGTDGLVRYKHRGEDPMQSDNRAMRDAMVRGRPLIYFVGVGSGVYSAHYPVWIQAEDRARLEFAIAVDEAQLSVGSGVDTVWPSREHSLRLTHQRLHQPVFRTQVFRAYDQSCAMCRLKHVELLDAAHILPDSHERGLPVVPNGLALCKIHHAAYDRNIIGIRPDLTVEVRSEILTEIDGPMLKYGLQAMNGERINVPRSRESKPDPDRLEERYAEFRASA